MPRGVEPHGGRVQQRPPRSPTVAAPGRMGPQIALPVRGIDPLREPVSGRTVEMHLADGRGLVLQIAQPFAHREHIVGQPRAELSHTDGVGEFPGDQGLPARRTERRVAKRPFEQDPVACQPVEVRRGLPRITIDPQGSPSVVVGDDHEQIGGAAIVTRIRSGPEARRQAHRQEQRRKRGKHRSAEDHSRTTDRATRFERV